MEYCTPSSLTRLRTERHSRERGGGGGGGGAGGSCMILCHTDNFGGFTILAECLILLAISIAHILLCMLVNTQDPHHMKVG